MSVELEAGRELDARVAAKVFGAKWDEGRCRICGWPLTPHPATGCTARSCSMRPAPTKRADEPPPYSTDIREAWLAVERMRELGWSFRYGNNGCSKDQHAAAFARGFRGLGANILTGEYIEADDAVAISSTAALAICRAALKALEVQHG